MSNSNMVQEQKELLETLVNGFAEKMKAKLIQKSLQGWNGWENCPIEVLKQGLENHIEKGDMVDIANYALLLDARYTKLQQSDESSNLLLEHLHSIGVYEEDPKFSLAFNGVNNI